MVIKGANALSSLCAYSSSTSGIEGMLQAIGVSVGLVVFIYLAINILFLVIVGNIAKSKGLSSLLWSILALIFGFPILIIVLILPNYNSNSTVVINEPRHNDSQKVFSGYGNNIKQEKWTCPKCGNLNVANANHCIYCYTSKIALKKWVCPKCKEENNIKAGYCINCYTKKP